jgi:2-polyprenyl-6-methoxyphenol hydroxylase-like FAD-dependent oxidoreductase
MNGGRVYWFAVKNAPEDARSPGGERDELRRIFRDWHDPIPDLIEATDEALILRNDIYDRAPLRRWGQGRVTLLGDAAHPMTPNLGQGACQALEDAVVLADCLREAGDTGAALRAYEAGRIPRTTFLVNRSRDIGRVAQWQHPLAVWARDHASRLLLPRLQAHQLQRIIGDGMEEICHPAT